MSKQRLIYLPLVMAFATAVPAAASTLGGLVPAEIASGSASIRGCDSAVTVTYGTEAGEVTSIAVAGIADPDCEGGRLSITLLDSAGSQLASGGPQTIAADADAADNSLSVAVTPQPHAAQVAAVAVSISGP